MTDYRPTRTTYGSTQPVWARDLFRASTHGLVLDGDAFLVDHPDGVVPSGTEVARADGGLGVPAGTDGAIPGGHLLNETQVRPGSRNLQAVLHAGTVTERLLPGGAVSQATRAALTRITYL